MKLVTIALCVCGCLFSGDKTILITGGAGYIGSHTCKALYEAGWEPVVYDSLISGSKDAVKWGAFVQGDLSEDESLDRAFELYKPKAVIHFAALCNIGDAIKDPYSYYSTNVGGTIHLLRAMLKHDVKHIIFSSSCTVYGPPENDRIAEDQDRNPINPYSTSKFMVERILEDFNKAYDLKYYILRYFNAAGLDFDSGLRRTEKSYNFLIPRTLLSLLEHNFTLSVFGDDYATPDGTAIRDYIHVSDLADAHTVALSKLLNTSECNATNLGTGRGYSVLEIINAIEEVTGLRVPYTVVPRREGDLEKTVADPSKSFIDLEFVPKHSDLKTIIEGEWKGVQETYNIKNRS